MAATETIITTFVVSVNVNTATVFVAVTKTTTYFDAIHSESDHDSSLNYSTNRDLAQSTAFQILARECGSGNDDAPLAALAGIATVTVTVAKLPEAIGSVVEETPVAHIPLYPIA